MKINVVTSIARQIDGEYVFIKVEKAFTQSDKANLFMNSMKNSLLNNGKNKSVTLTVDNQQIECLIEIGLFEVELEE